MIILAKTSTEPKNLWNSKNYTQLKVSLKPDITTTFKAVCAKNDVSMTSVISQLICQYCGIAIKKGDYSPVLSTKRQRRAAVRNTILLLERIRDNEELYRDNIPTNLQASAGFESAESCISALDEAIDLLESAY